MNEGKNQTQAAAMASMSPTTARKYLRSGKLPSELKKEHSWRTRPDPFADAWDEIRRLLEINPALQVKTVFEHLQRTNPGKYQDGQRRTLERRVQEWRRTAGPPREVFFPQEHRPGELGASDFTHMSELNVTINREPFKHMMYHFVLTYSNWETGTVCYSESFESLSEGFQNALWELGGVPREHLTDRLSAAVNNLGNQAEFTKNYAALLRHYGLEGRKTQAGRGNENGDAEQSHNRFKQAVDQALMLRGSRDFSSVEEYLSFLKGIFAQLNSGRRQRFAEELKTLRALPARRIDSSRTIDVRVAKSGTIRVLKNVYSLDSRLIGATVRVRVHADRLEILYGGKLLETISRLQGEKKHRIDYRHVIHSLVQKPGAFERYQYRDDLFPSTYFKAAHDILKNSVPSRANREYLRILKLAAEESEAATELALRRLINEEQAISFEAVRAVVATAQKLPSAEDVQVAAVNLAEYDSLLVDEEDAA